MNHSRKILIAIVIMLTMGWLQGLWQPLAFAGHATTQNTAKRCRKLFDQKKYKDALPICKQAEWKWGQVLK